MKKKAQLNTALGNVFVVLGKNPIHRNSDWSQVRNLGRRKMGEFTD